MTMDVKSLSINNPTSTTNKGLKVAKIQKQSKHGILGGAFWSSKDLTETPCPPYCYDEEKHSSRLSLDLRCDGEYLEIFKGLGFWAVEYIAADSLRLTYWGMDKLSRKAPEGWTTATLRPQTHIAYLYITETSCGIALDGTDIQVCKELSANVWS